MFIDSFTCYQHPLPKRSHGFTMMELMLVVAVIAILASLAMFAYSSYQAKTKFAAALSEIRGGISAFEVAINEAGTVSGPNDIGLQASTYHCNIMIQHTEMERSITCTLINAPSQLAGGKIKLNNVAGRWECMTNKMNYAPASCLAQ